MINSKQFNFVSKLFDDYYDIHEPHHAKYEAIKALKQRLNRKKVLNVNVVENEQTKIKKENAGQGANLDTSMRTDDPSMVLFHKELGKFLLNPNREDKFMQMKIKQSKKKKL